MIDFILIFQDRCIIQRISHEFFSLYSDIFLMIPITLAFLQDNRVHHVRIPGQQKWLLREEEGSCPVLPARTVQPTCHAHHAVCGTPEARPEPELYPGPENQRDTDAAG